jgi:dGTPase
MSYDWLQQREVERAHVADPEQSSGDPRSPFERDRARIIHSVAFRRLQGKTQVFAPGWADFLRTRVTHSIEVAQIGRALGQRFDVPGELVEAACLGHDLGHPPFGHTGEQVLDEVLKERGARFEGNAQSFRIVTRLEAKAPDYEGLDLCRATLLGILKYPYRIEAGFEKFLYDDDAEAFEGWLFEGTSLRLLTAHDASERPQRTLPCQLMDWADDVAYSVHDLEDGIISGFLQPATWRYDDFIDTICESVGRAPVRWKGKPPDRDTVADVLEHVTQRLVKYGAEVPKDIIRDVSRHYIDRFATAGDVVTRGEGKTAFDYELVVPETIRIENQVLKSITFEYVIRDARTATFAYKGREVVRRLFEALYDNATVKGPGRYILFPRDLRRELADYRGDDVKLARIVADYIASMTEGQAMALFARLFESTSTSPLPQG